MRKVLVTGATGHIGSHLCHCLLREGAEVHAVSRRVTPDEHSEIRWWRADLNLQESDAASWTDNLSGDLLELRKPRN